MEEIKIQVNPAIITANLPTLKEWLARELESYRGVLYTEELKTQAKKDVAEIRKKKKEFQEAIKGVKNEYMRPLEEFIEQANELLLLFDEPVDFINEQIAEFEKKRIEAKKKRIEEIYNEFMPDQQELLPLVAIWEDRWLNATTSEKSIKDAIYTARQKAISDTAVIKGLNSDIENRLLEYYLNSRDLAAVMLMHNNYENDKRIALEKERLRQIEEAERKAREDERRRIEEEKRIAEALEEAREQGAQEVIEMLSAEEPTVNDAVTPYTYTFFLTSAQKDALDTYLASVGFQYDETTEPDEELPFI